TAPPTPPPEPAAPADATLDPPSPAVPGAGPWLQARGDLAWWPAQSWRPGGGLAAGVALGPHLGLGMGLGITGRLDLGGDRSYRDLTLRLPLESRLWRLRPHAAPTLAVRTFLMPSQSFSQTELFPGVDLGLAWPWRVAPPLEIALDLAWHADFTPYMVDGEASRAQTLSLGLDLRLFPRQ
ncbi:MAG: hypothetical protein ABIO70_25450, partial [Pseudomonadota bacterium]